MTLLFSMITAGLILAYAVVIYFSAKENRENEFYALLKKEAVTKANLFFNAKVDEKTLQDIYKNNRQIINEVEVAIYDTNFRLLYHDAVDIDIVKETPEMLSEIRKNGELAFYQKEWQVVGLLYRYGDHEYILTAAALDQYGYNKLNSLLRNNILVFIISIVFVFLAGRYFSRKAFEPIMEMTEKAKVISATNLDLRLSTTDTGDELAELANTFNQMLERLEKSFDAQKAFVSNISHELRTPLTALIAELELALVSTGISESTRLSLQNSLLDAKKLVRLTNSLLDLAKASYDPAEISFKNVRIDEVLLDAMHQLQQTNPEYRIDLYFEPNISEDETEYTGHPAIDAITIKANEYLLKSAFINLMENGCKFSDDHRCTVSIGLSDHKTATAVHNTHNKSDGENRKPIVVVTIRDQGIGISESDLENIFNPFFRGKNKNYTEGNGIGLSLSQKIIQLHQGKMHVASELHKGTIITLHFPCSPVAD